MSALQKRSRDAEESDDSFSDHSLSAEDDFADSDTIDISSALTNRKRRKVVSTGASNFQETDDALQSGDDDGIIDLIATSITKRNAKAGTEVLKNVKGGKRKLAKGEVGGGSFQSMGLSPWLLRSLSLQGFRTPTPIQRLSIPILLSSPPRDLVGMARTGSGKTLAFLLPLIQRFGGRHSAFFGARALILLPARELALQVFKVGKELSRGWKEGDGDHAGDKDGDGGGSDKRTQGLRWGLIVGGESMDEQFEMISSNPDIIIATPGRLLHLAVEMNLDLRSVEYVVFDEADRLFEMGFETALTELVHRLPSSRQTILFSATLPKSLVEFARAGLQNPKLVRLDAESKISADLRMAFFSVKQDEKEASLITLLRDVIGVPLGNNKAIEDDSGNRISEKRSSKRKAYEHFTAPHQTLVFAATKHHVEYLTNLLAAAGYAVSHIYGSLDQVARTQQMDQFRRGQTNVLVVTDVAARGIDIPVLENVVNYDFPHGARVFVHRIGRTARAGRQGWAWSFVTNTDLPHLLDLQLFLARPVISTISPERIREESTYTESLVIGSFPRETIDEEVEYVRSLDTASKSLPALREVMRKGHGMYERSKGKASQASYRRAKDMTRDPARWGLVNALTISGTHPVLMFKGTAANDLVQHREEDEKRTALLRAINSFQPTETALEVGTKGKTGNADLMKERRKALRKASERYAASSAAVHAGTGADVASGKVDDIEMADEEDIQAVFNTSGKTGKDKYRDGEFYMSHYQEGAETEKGYSLRDGASFTEQARNATFDLAGDEGLADQKRAKLSWDKKKKKFIKGDGEGADNIKMVKTESGIKLPATYRSGRFDEWKAKNRLSLPKVGEAEGEATRRFSMGGRKFKHKQVKDAKPLEKLSNDYERKSRQLKKRAEQGEESRSKIQSGKGRPGQKSKSRYGSKSIGKVKSELKSVEQIRKERNIVEKRKAKNARPSRKKGKR